MADLTLNGTDTDTNLTLDLNDLPNYNPDVVPNSVPSPVGDLTLNGTDTDTILTLDLTNLPFYKPVSDVTTSIWDSFKKYWWLILALVLILYLMFRKRR